MPEVFLEAEEIKRCIRRLRPDWLIPNPNTTEVDALKYDWTRLEGGFWAKAGADIAPPVTDESLREEETHLFAQEEAKEIRGRVMSRKESLPDVSYRNVLGAPVLFTPGWLGLPVEHWRAPSLHQINQELAIYASPYREWIDYEIDVNAILAAPEQFTKLWYYQIHDVDAPRQWLRGCFEYLQAYHKVTSGNPVDSQLSSHLVDVDVVVSADRNFVRFVEKCKQDAPFAVAAPRRIAGGDKGVEELLLLLQELGEQRAAQQAVAADGAGPGPTGSTV